MITREQVDAARAAVGVAHAAQKDAARAEWAADAALREARKVLARLKRDFEQQQADGETDLETVTRHIMERMAAAGIIEPDSPLLTTAGVWAQVMPQDRLMILIDKMINDWQQHERGLRSMDAALAAYGISGGPYIDRIHKLGAAAIKRGKEEGR